MERGVYFDAWFPSQHNYHPSFPPRRLKMIDHLQDYRTTMLVWAALGARLWPPRSRYFPKPVLDADGQEVTDILEECAQRDIHGRPCHALWIECPDREHWNWMMDRINPVWRQYLEAVVRLQIDAGCQGIHFDEAEVPITSLQYGGCFCRTCMRGFTEHLRSLPPPGAPRRAGRPGPVGLPRRPLAAGARPRLQGRPAGHPAVRPVPGLPAGQRHPATSPSWPPTPASTRPASAARSRSRATSSTCSTPTTRWSRRWT